MPLIKNAVSMLKKDHEKVRTLFKKLFKADPEDRAEIFQEIRREVELHAYVEETIFYPAVRSIMADESVVTGSYEDHEEVREIIGELAKEDSMTDTWLAKASILNDEIEEHVQEEETMLMPLAEEKLGWDGIRNLGREIEAEKKRMQEMMGEDRGLTLGQAV